MKLHGDWFRWVGTDEWGFGWKHGAPFRLVVEKQEDGRFHYSVSDKSEQCGLIASGTVSSLGKAQKAATDAMKSYIKNHLIQPKEKK